MIFSLIRKKELLTRLKIKAFENIDIGIPIIFIFCELLRNFILRIILKFYGL